MYSVQKTHKTMMLSTESNKPFQFLHVTVIVGMPLPKPKPMTLPWEGATFE
jgi:hypothetical protein